MREEDFANELVEKIGKLPSSFQIGTKVVVLYDLTISQNGCVEMGVNFDTGEPIRGKGKGFEQDIVIYKNVEDGHTSIVPYVIVEVKYNNVTTHDAIVYSNKAKKIKNIYPHARYGLVIGGFSSIPGRVLRHGADFDFIVSLNYAFEEDEITSFTKVIRSELKTANKLEDIRSTKVKLHIMQKKLMCVESM